MFKPLNRTLYDLLERRFGPVKVVNPGSPMTRRLVRDPISRRSQYQVEDPGEYYAVNCPYCGDTRKRLYVNHRWGVEDELGHNNLHLIVCYNERCLHTAQRRADFLEDLTVQGIRLAGARVAEAAPSTTPKRAELPGECIRLDRVPSDNPGAAYLRERRFNLGRLSREYGVCWCEESRYALARGRIIIPVRESSVLRGWQARYPGDLDWKEAGAPPKYWTMPGMPRRDLVYNLDMARLHPTLVVCEGVTDAWRVGPMGVAIFGSSISEGQARRLSALGRDRTVAVLFDGDATGRKAGADTASKLSSRLGKGRVCEVALPRGQDPGEMTRAGLHKLISDQAAVQNVPVQLQGSRTGE